MQIPFETFLFVCIQIDVSLTIRVRSELNYYNRVKLNLYQGCICVRKQILGIRVFRFYPQLCCNNHNAASRWYGYFDYKEVILSSIVDCLYVVCNFDLNFALLILLTRFLPITTCYVLSLWRLNEYDELFLRSMQDKIRPMWHCYETNYWHSRSKNYSIDLYMRFSPNVGDLNVKVL